MTPEQPAEAEKKLTVGERLKQGRLRQRLSILECAKRTHISLRYLEALEEARWDDLPSESHRLGFLQLYARFLGVPSDEITHLYHHEQSQLVMAPEKKSSSKKASDHEVPSRVSQTSSAWYPTSISQLVTTLIVLLVMAWGIYHVVQRRLPDQRLVPIARPRTDQSPRLVSTQRAASVQKIRVQAQQDAFLRVSVTNGQLLYEGILPAGSFKEWNGLGPFDLKIGNVQSLSVFWNDQPVDIQSMARGKILELQLPLIK